MSDPKPIPIQLGTQLAEHASGIITREVAENLYLETAPKGSKFRYRLRRTPGLAAFATTQAGHVRGAIRMGAYAFVVTGDTLYRVGQDAVVQEIGHIDGTGYVSMAEDGEYVVIATETKCYAATAAGIWELSLTGVVGVAAQDGYFLFLLGDDLQRFFVAEDPLSIDPLDFTNVDAFPGLNRGCVSDDREFLAFQDRAVTVYVNTGNAGFPFTRQAVIEFGCVSGASIARAEGAVFWLGSAREGGLQVYAMQGYSPQAIAPSWVVEMIEAQGSPQTAKGIAYQQGGHVHYVLTFPGLTLAYDLKEGTWHRRRSYGLDRWRVSTHVWMEPWRKHIVGDYATGQLYELDPETYDEDGDPLIARAVGAPAWDAGQEFIIDEFFLDIEAGVGLPTGQGSDPQVMLRWTNDGVTWSTQLSCGFGAIGRRETQVRFNRLGTHRCWIPEVSVSDPVPVVINGAYYRPEGLAA